MKDEKTQIKQEEIIELVSSFCDEKLDDEYKQLSIKLVEKMGRKREVPFKRGKVEIWASAVIYALGQINFLFDKSNEPYATPDDICDYFNTKKSTVSNKARDIRDMFNMGHFDSEFSLSHILESQPSFYIDEKSGMIIPEDFIVNPMDSYFDEVYAQFEKGEMDNAIAMLDAIEKDNPEYERAMFYKSFILNASGIEDNSSEIFQEFLSNLDDDIDLAELLEDDDEEFDENNPEDLFEIGEIHFYDEEYEEAIKYFDLSLKIHQDPDVLEYKAYALAELKKYKQALKTIDKAIKQAPDNDTYWANKGNIYVMQKKYKKALKCYDKAIELDDEDVDYYIYKSNVYIELKDYENAEKMLDTAEKIDNENLEVLCEKGNYLLQTSKPEEALIYYDKCLSIDDEYEKALLFKAVACSALGLDKEIDKCIEKLAEVNPLLLYSLDQLFEDSDDPI
ncbi:MAG: tetratricopeptide repeat protein [Methanobrevibacter sp.]|uniref:DUF6398 domain-containing protein n=1 Tax=Methanobrevibacter sp. TaxID=66852 RepID=UPI0025F16470|nr:DUF6398 domain-containing protein [Methanobrevibacter sp.]MBR0272088.1 tetratricopeptide repeat protein [Methanobrevibacter sp.]